MDKGPLPRVAAFDHVRGLAVIFMIISHIPLILGTSGAEKSVIGLIMSQVCGTAPAAPVFMVLMGIFFSYPYDKPTGTKVRRGVKIFLLGMLLNLGRFMVPALIGASFIPGFAESMTATFHMSGREMVWYAIYSPDILHFAGIAFIILALMGPLVERPYVWGAIAVAVACIAPGLWGTGEGKAFYPLVQPLWGSALSPGVPADTTFPVFPWLVYPMVGALIGRSLMAGMDEGTLFRRMLAGGSALIVIGGIVVALQDNGPVRRLLPDVSRRHPRSLRLRPCLDFPLPVARPLRAISKGPFTPHLLERAYHPHLLCSVGTPGKQHHALRVQGDKESMDPLGPRPGLSVPLLCGREAPPPLRPVHGLFSLVYQIARRSAPPFAPFPPYAPLIENGPRPDPGP